MPEIIGRMKIAGSVATNTDSTVRHSAAVAAAIAVISAIPVTSPAAAASGCWGATPNIIDSTAATTTICTTQTATYIDAPPARITGSDTSPVRSRLRTSSSLRATYRPVTDE